MLRKAICLLLCAMVVCHEAFAATYVASIDSWEFPNYSILFNDAGELLLPLEARYAVTRIGEKQDWFALPVDDEASDLLRYALINKNGEQVTERLFDGFHDATENTVIFTEYDGETPRYGLLDSSGSEILPATYSMLEPFGDTHLFTVDENGCVIIIDEDGSMTPTPWPKAINRSDWGGDYDYLGTYEELLPAVDPSTGLTGYLDPDGEWAIEPQFVHASAFMPDNRGLASVYGSSMREGLIDMQGNIVIPTEYRAILTDHPRYIEAVRSDTRHDFYTWDGKPVFTGGPEISRFGAGFYDSEKNVFLDAHGNAVTLDLADYEMRLMSDSALRNEDTKDWHLLKNDLTLTETGYSVISFLGLAGDSELFAARKTFQLADSDACYALIDYCTLLDMDGNERIPFEKKLLEINDVPLAPYFVFLTESTIGIIDPQGRILLEAPLPQNDAENTDSPAE